MIDIEITYAKIRDICVLIIGFQISNAILQFLYHHFLVFWVKKPLVFEDLGEWAVIAGSLNGLGRAFVEQFASRNMNIVLIDKKELDLAYQAKYIEEKYEVLTLTIPTDFSACDNDFSFNSFHTQIMDLDIGVMVVNIHELQDRPSLLIDDDTDSDFGSELERIIDGNVEVATNLCSVVLPGMIYRDRGALVLVASWTAELPTPMMATSAASKAYCASLAKNLRAELGRNIVVKTVLPGPLYCRWMRLRSPSWLAPAPDDYLTAAMPLIARHDVTSGYWPHDIASGFINLLEYVYPSLAHDFIIQCMELLRDVSIRGYL